MSYEILSDDIKASSGSKKKKGKNGSKFNMMYVHIGIIIIVLILLLFYLFSVVDFKIKDSDKKDDLITIVGSLNDFNETYNKSLIVEVSDFVLTTPIGKFNDRSKEIEIEDFVGLIYYQNKTMIITGKAKSIIYAKNEIKLQGQNFQLNSTKKTTMDLVFEKVTLDYDSGRIKINSDLNYEFGNSTMILNNFNFTFGYDGIFSFQGTTDSFSLLTHNPELEINYANE